MKKTDKNIIMITCGGTGQRFGTDIPKQYQLLNGKPVVAYVIEACKRSRIADAILVVAAPPYHDLLRQYGVDVTAGGAVLNQSKRNGFDYIREHSSCEKLVVVEAVRPFLMESVVDDIFERLDEYDAVSCAKKMIDTVAKYDTWVLDREQYYTMNPPQGFRFPLIDRYFKSDSIFTESIQQLPETTKVFLKFDVPYFEKITYPEDFEKAQALLEYREKHGHSENGG